MNIKYPYFKIDLYSTSAKGYTGSFYFQPQNSLSVHQAEYIFNWIVEGVNILDDEIEELQRISESFCQITLIYGTLYNKAMYGSEDLNSTPYFSKDIEIQYLDRNGYLKALRIFENVLQQQADGAKFLTKNSLLEENELKRIASGQ